MPEYGYPTEDDLYEIANFRGTPQAFVDYIEHIYPGYGSVRVEDGIDIMQRPCKTVSTVTGGWSGCEEIDAIIHRGWGGDGIGMFYMRYWESTHRGGLTKYSVPDEQWEVEQHLGDIKHLKKEVK